MGTNYYLHRDICPHCKRSGERLHIGKSSAGWCFSLHVDAAEGINSLADWQDLWSRQDSRIVDEYGDELSPDDMLRIIIRREWRRTYEYPAAWYTQNHAEPGPNGLARHRIDQRHCIGHGNGTYDLIVGEFS